MEHQFSPEIISPEEQEWHAPKAEAADQSLTLLKEFQLSPERLEQMAEASLDLIAANQHPETGLLPAADVTVEGHCDKEHEYDKAWMRDMGTVMTSLILARRADVMPPHLEEKAEIIIENALNKGLKFFGQERFLKPWQQDILEKQDEQGNTYTALTGPASEVHFNTDGTPSGPWDHNQPEANAQFLMAAAFAAEDGLVEYNDTQKETLRTLTDYLIRIEPDRFEGSAMWEGLPVRSPSSRSNALAIAKALDAAGSALFADDSSVQERIEQTVARSMNFVKGPDGQAMYHDFTMPASHPNGFDLAMKVELASEGSEATYIPYQAYVERSNTTLKGDQFPGNIRFIGDPYYRSDREETREGSNEAVWLMGSMVNAIGYFNESKRAYESGYVQVAQELREKGIREVKKFTEVKEHVGYYPELFIQRDPEKVADDKKDQCLITHDQGRLVALEPNANDLLWNHALAIQASAMAISMAKLDMSAGEEELQQAA